MTKMAGSKNFTSVARYSSGPEIAPTAASLKAAGMGRRLAYSIEQLSEQDLQILRPHIEETSRPVMKRLENWLGGEVKVEGKEDAEHLRFTMTFTHECLGLLGQVNLIFEEGSLSPLPFRVTKTLALTGVLDTPEERAAARKRKAALNKILGETKKLFIVKPPWRILYYRGGELIEMRSKTNETMKKVARAAYSEAPPGADTVKLMSPKGKTLIRKENKQWVRES
jgi:hypothetical protein